MVNTRLLFKIIADRSNIAHRDRFINIGDYAHDVSSPVVRDTRKVTAKPPSFYLEIGANYINEFIAANGFFSLVKRNIVGE